MKTRIITLESHDDLISVRDRMSWAKTPRILLVAPKFETIVLRQVDLKVLQRHASSLGAELGIITRVKRVRDDAASLGIPVFESTGEAQREPWIIPYHRRFPRRPPAKDLRQKRDQFAAGREAKGWQTFPLTRFGFFLIGVISVFAIIALFIPRAQFVLHPQVETQSVTLPVTASPSIDSVFITGTIPARERTVIVDGEQTVAVTGEGIVPQSKAGGMVEFRNLTQSVQVLPTGTVVRAAGVRFATTESVTLDAGVGKKIEVSVQAVEGGLAGNVDAQVVNIVDGRLGLLVSVTNPEPITGGRELSSVQASDADRERARDLLLKFLDGEARGKFLEEKEPGDVVFEDTVAVSQVLSEEYDPPPGAASSTLTLKMQAEYSARFASAQDLELLASLALNASLPSGFHALSNAVSLESLNTPILSGEGTARWTVHAVRKIEQTVDAASLRRAVLGRSLRVAQATLNENLPPGSDPEIRITPSWWRWIPMLPFRVEVVTE